MAQRQPTWSDEITTSDVQGRSEATRLARSDRRAAFRVARKIAHPWYRCQALTAVAQESDLGREERVDVLMEALAAAYEQTEPNRVACVGAWPLRALVAVEASVARPQAERLLATIAGEPHGLRRLDGLRGILGAVFVSKELRDLVLPAFVRAADASSGWRTERIVAYMAEAIGDVDIATAMALLRKRGVNRFTSRALAALDRVRQAS